MPLGQNSETRYGRVTDPNSGDKEDELSTMEKSDTFATASVAREGNEVFATDVAIFAVDQSIRVRPGKT